jgi:biopolymer transport protein ExbD
MSIRLDHGEDSLGEIHEINVTPFIDVILVLLATVDVAVDLPTSNAVRQPRPDKPIFLTIKSDLSLAIGDSAVSRDALQSTLDQLSNNDRSMRIFLRADKSVPYGELMNAMNSLRSAGYLKVALVGLESDVAQ